MLLSEGKNTFRNTHQTLKMKNKKQTCFSVTVKTAWFSLCQDFLNDNKEN